MLCTQHSRLFFLWNLYSCTPTTKYQKVVARFLLKIKKKFIHNISCYEKPTWEKTFENRRVNQNFESIANVKSMTSWNISKKWEKTREKLHADLASLPPASECVFYKKKNLFIYFLVTWEKLKYFLFVSPHRTCVCEYYDGKKN